MTGRVALFVPCLAEHLDVRAAEATARLLRHLGVALDYPSAQTCCGQPFRTSGDLASADRLARRFAKVFGDADAIVTPSASCAAMLRHHAPADVTIGTRVFELSDFLTRLGFDASQAEWPGTVAYHPSCHGRALPDATTRLLAAVRGLTLVPLPAASQCCGFGGAFATRFAAISVALGKDKLAHAEAAAPTLIVNDTGCRVHLRGLPSQVELKHLAEVLAEGLHLMPRPPRIRGPA